jgi:hypothetical protein
LCPVHNLYLYPTLHRIMINFLTKWINSTDIILYTFRSYFNFYYITYTPHQRIFQIIVVLHNRIYILHPKPPSAWWTCKHGLYWTRNKSTNFFQQLNDTKYHWHLLTSLKDWTCWEPWPLQHMAFSCTLHKECTESCIWSFSVVITESFTHTSQVWPRHICWHYRMPLWCSRFLPGPYLMMSPSPTSSNNENSL